MAGKTEQKILDAALKVFSEKGYKGATIKVIALKAGFSELTLFNKFNNKRNLYEMVMLQNTEKVKKEFLSLLSEEDYKSPEEYLRTIITELANAIEKNFNFLKLAASEKSDAYASLVMEFHLIFVENLKKHVKNRKINYLSFALDITAFLFMHVNGVKTLEVDIDPEYVVNGYIDNCILLIHA